MIGAGAEILGAITVVATILYLAVQIRQSERTQRAQTHQQITSDRRQVLLSLMENDKVRDAIRKASRGEALTEDETAIAFWFTVINIRAYENEIYQHSLGMIDDSELANQTAMLELPQMQLELVAELSLNTYTPRVQEDIRRILAKREAGT